MKTCRLPIVVFFALAALLVGPITAAQADTATPLPFIEASTSLAVDPVGQHVFVSDGGDTSSIIVLDYNGNIVKTITGEDGASEMALDSATHTLYVALRDATAISEIDTQTLTETTRFSTAPYSDPTNLVIANGKLWFSSTGTGNCCVVSANLDGTGMAAASLPDGVANPGEYTALAAGGAGGKLLAVGQLHSTGQTAVAVYDISQDPPALVSSTSDADGCYFADGMTMDPAGANLFLACNFPHSVIGLSTSDLSSSTEYPVGAAAWPPAVAASADGNYLAGGATACGNDQPGDDVFVFPIGNTTPARKWSIGLCSVESLAFSPDASQLFAVAGAGVGAGLDFYTLDQPTVPMTETVTSLTPSQTSLYAGQPLTLTAHVTGTATGTVHLYGAPEDGGSETLLATGSVGAGGDVVFNVNPGVSTVYTAVLDAGQGYAASISPAIVVTVTPPTVSLSASQDSIYAGQQDTLTADVTGASTGTVDLYGTPNGGNKTLVATEALTTGEADFTVSPTVTTTYSAVLEAGDGHSSATSPDLIVTVTPVAATTVSLSSSAQSILAGGGQATLTAQVTGTSTGTVDLYATPKGGAKTLLTTGAVTAGGAVFTVSPTVTTTYSAVLEAGMGYTSSTSQDTTVTFVPRSMPIAVSQHSVIYGGKIRLKLTGVTSGTVDLFALPNGQKQVLVKKATVAAGKGSVTFAVPPKRTTVYFAEREDLSAASNNVRVSVRPHLVVAVAAKKVSPQVLRRHGETVVIGAGRKPALPGEPLEIEIDRARPHGGWQIVARGQVPVGPSGIVVLVGTIKRAGQYRAQASYGGDSNYASVKSAWRSFQVG